MDVQVAGQDISPEVTAQSGWLTARSHRSKRGTDNSTAIDESSQAPSNRPRSRARQPLKAQVLKIGSPVVTAAILQAAKLTDEESLEDTVCPNTQQNIVFVSTPHSGHADRYTRISSIQVNRVTHEVNAYETPAEHTTKGVIRGIPLTETPQQIHNKIVAARNPTALATKRIASTTTVIIAFDRPDVPFQPSHLSTSRPLHPQHQNQVTLPNTVKAEPFPLENSISIQATTLKIPVCIGITHHIYQPEQAHLKRENAILRDLLTKLTQEVRDLKQSQTPAPTPITQNAPAHNQEPPTTPAPKKRALQDGAMGQVRSEIKTFSSHFKQLRTAEVVTRNNRYLINTYASIPAARMLSYFKNPITPPPRSLVIKPTIPPTLFAGSQP
ncbi:hypothetical protein HPB49_015176 [Dermacentor silvarum]|uniref:Uncharacterized protein n=1 Tax=Dermacentor silvarum TaxID=543639 RepID=A0ACB8CRY0_DERSI|nr:hypothetical protein HPB49_015176 [Dermacentor silvarum]